MRVKRILCIVLSLTAVFSLMLIRESVAWINTESGTILSQDIYAKKLNYEFAGELGSYLMDESGNEYILPGRNLIMDNGGMITAVNSSTIDTQLRFKVIYHRPSAGNPTTRETAVCTGASTEDLVLGLPASFKYDSGDGFFYYYNNPSSQVEANKYVPAVSSGTTTITLLTSIMYNDSTDSNNPVTMERYNPEVNGVRTPFRGYVKVIVQVKQKNHVGWNDVGGITWTTNTTLPTVS